MFVGILATRGAGGWGLGAGGWGLGVGAGGWGLGAGVWGVGCGVWGVGCGVWGVGCGGWVWGLGVGAGCGGWVWGLGVGGWGVGEVGQLLAAAVKRKHLSISHLCGIPRAFLHGGFRVFSCVSITYIPRLTNTGSLIPPSSPTPLPTSAHRAWPKACCPGRDNPH